MSEFVWMYLGFSGFQMIAGTVMIVTYSVSFPWWRDPLGRMMVTYATADLLMALLLCVTVVWHLHPVWFRAVWFALQVMMGAAFCFQTRTILQIRRVRAARARQTHRSAHGAEDPA